MAWPKGQKRGPRLQQPTSLPLQSPSRIGHNSNVVALGRDGEELTRKRTVSSDIFYIDPRIIPPGWDYQWNVLEVIGQPQTAQRLAMAENGWRPVPAGRHPGLFMPADYNPNAPIIRDGLQLEERPMTLTQEARAEELAKANKQVSDQIQQLRLSRNPTKGLPDGFSDDSQYRGTGPVARTTYAPAPDAPRPALPIDQT